MANFWRELFRQAAKIQTVQFPFPFPLSLSLSLSGSLLSTARPLFDLHCLRYVALKVVAMENCGNATAAR
jgi:hypothetical protein